MVPGCLSKNASVANGLGRYGISLPLGQRARLFIVHCNEDNVSIVSGRSAGCKISAPSVIQTHCLHSVAPRSLRVAQWELGDEGNPCELKPTPRAVRER